LCFSVFNLELLADLTQDIPTQVAASGLLKNNAVFNFHVQCGVAEHAVKFLWLIDGEEGNIRIEDCEKNWLRMDPDVLVNGEKIVPGIRQSTDGLGEEEKKEEEEDVYALVRRAWNAFADGKVGEYPSIEDALRNRRVIDAMKESAVTGKRIIL
jgi:predicted dehydrogenase